MGTFDGSAIESLVVLENVSGNVFSGNVFSVSNTWRFNYNESLQRLEIEYFDGTAWGAKAVLAQL